MPQSRVTGLCFSRSCRSRFAVLLVLAGMLTSRAYSQDAVEGKTLFFDEKKCNICHTIGGGKLIGPDLQGVVDKREREWLIRQIVEPDKMVAEKDPIVLQLLAEYNNAAMPVFGLNRQQAESIIAFLQNPTDGGDVAGLAPGADTTFVPFAISTILPDVEEQEIVKTGEKYFDGELLFSNGGPACVSCHHVTQSGLFGGGSLGPDLTPAFQKFTEQGLASLLTSIPYPTMSPIFKDKLLTPEETAYVVGYLKAKSSQRSLPVGANISLFTVLGFCVLIFAAPLIWQNRLGAVRKKLLRGN